VVQQIQLDPRYFGEGITIFNQRIIQLTYKTQSVLSTTRPRCAVSGASTIRGKAGRSPTMASRFT